MKKRYKFTVLSIADLVMFGMGIGVVLYYALIGRIGKAEEEEGEEEE